jgi:hypothetical protein
MPVHRVGFLAVLHQADNPAVHLDGELDRVGIVADRPRRIVVVARIAPPPRHFRFVQDGQQGGTVAGVDRPQHQP